MFLEFSVQAGPLGERYRFNLKRAASATGDDLARTDGNGVIVRSGDVEAHVRNGAALEFRQGSRSAAALTVELLHEREVVAIGFDRVGIEKNGPLSAVAIASGAAVFSGGTLKVDLRVSSALDVGVLRLDLTIHNPRRAHHPDNFWELGDEGSLLFGGLRLTVTPSGSVESCDLSNNGADWAPVDLPLDVYQESSGGENWASRVHIDRTGSVPMRLGGYRVTTASRLHEGTRTQPVVVANTAENAWAATLLNFWEEFPSAVEVSTEGIAMWPFPDRFPTPYELQGGEKKTRSFLLAFGDASTARTAITESLSPVFVTTDARAVSSSGAVLQFVDEVDPRHQGLIQEGLDGERTFFHKREAQDEYGWRHFGDIAADHESAFTAGPALVSHYNNQYDAVAGFAVQYLRSGDARWWSLMDALARHVADIDIYHTDEDKAAYNGGAFWHTDHYVDAGKSTHRAFPRTKGVHGGGPAAEQNYNEGLALHYYLTGWQPSRDAAIGLANWVIAMEDGRLTPFRWLARGSTGLATASGNALYHGPGRAGGNSIKALLVGFELTGNRIYLDKAEELVRRCIHPADNIAALDLLDAERRWYYTVFFESVGRYLFVKNDMGERDDRYDYARAALLHYARWMRQHEYPYLEKPEILEFPTETWSAQDIRKSDVLALAALCEVGDERESFLKTSRRFQEDVLTRLPELPTHIYARPLVLMLGRGYARQWAVEHPDFVFRPASVCVDHGRPSPFEPQKVTAIRRAKILVIAAAAASAVAAFSALMT